ncbi:MAG: DUF6629 family protein [Bacteroidales bacterium]|nr:DUF6629 family protein [Bacteroidales bacterium]
MCFSAGASFAGGAVISAIGVATIAKNNDSSRRMFAGIPLIFGVQQISEGLVWVALQSPDHDLMLTIASYTFLFTAVIVWPVYLPLSVMLMEKVKVRRQIIFFLVVTGLVTTIYYGIGMLFYDVSPQISSHHIKYVNNFPRPPANAVFIIYLMATLVPLFVSGVRKMWLMGLLMTVSCLITGIFFREYLTSVWCFFAALISAVILWIVSEERQRLKA